MKILRILIGILSLSAIFVASARTIKLDDESDIRALYAKMDKAYNEKDIASFMAGISKNYVWHDWKGHVQSSKDMESDMKKEFANRVTCDDHVTIDSIDIKGSRATVVSTVKFDETYMEKGVRSRFSGTETAKDILMKTADGWIIDRSYNLNLDMNNNGTRIKREAPANKIDK